MQVRDIMSSPAITVTPESDIRTVARIMRENQISGVPVVDTQGELLGVITELDLIDRNAPVHQPRYIAVLSSYIPINRKEYYEYKEQLRHALAVNASELMTEKATTIAPDAHIEEALKLMLDPEIIILPVIEQHQIIGVVTRTDLVRLIEKLEAAPDDEEETAE